MPRSWGHNYVSSKQSPYQPGILSSAEGNHRRASNEGKLDGFAAFFKPKNRPLLPASLPSTFPTCGSLPLLWAPSAAWGQGQDQAAPTLAAPPHQSPTHQPAPPIPVAQAAVGEDEGGGEGRRGSLGYPSPVLNASLILARF
jgi:hypothetical protein